MVRPLKTTLRQKYPDIDIYWHPSKNNDLTPDNVGVRSEKVAWFRCPKNELHDHQTKIKNKTLVVDRNGGNWGCPFCSGYYFGSPEKSLASKHPDIAKEFHLTKNGGVTADNVPPSSNKKCWWQCEHGHEYELEPSQRTNAGRGCPQCSRYGHGSSQEIRIYCELKTLFPETKFRYKFAGKEVDVFVPEIGLGVEYDSEFFHRNKIDEDEAKNTLLHSLGINLVRVREHPLRVISDLDVISSTRQLSKDIINQLLDSIVAIAPSHKAEIRDYQLLKDFVNSKDFAQYTSYSNRPTPENSLAEKFPEISKQWDFTKNFPLTPYDFSHGSKHRAWWICDNGHSFEATINARTYRAKSKYKGCRYCARERSSPSSGDQVSLFTDED